MPIDLILLGGPGAGKGTQAERLQRWLQVPRVSSGDLFREAIANGSPLGQRAKEDMDRGELVPDEVTIGMVAERINKPDCAQGIIFDGFPRTLAQARALDDLLQGMKRRVDAVLNIEVSDRVLLERLAGRWTCSRCGRVCHRLHNPEKVHGICDVCGGQLYQRDDDTPETQRRRIQVYREQTAPLVAYYRGRGSLVDIDGEKDVNAVERQVRAVMGAHVASDR